MDEAKEKAKKTYDLAADSFDHPANSYWDRYGRLTVERLGLKEGDCVLDVGCGAGASALVVRHGKGSGKRTQRKACLCLRIPGLPEKPG